MNWSVSAIDKIDDSRVREEVQSCNDRSVCNWRTLEEEAMFPQLVEHFANVLGVIPARTNDLGIEYDKRR